MLKTLKHCHFSIFQQKEYISPTQLRTSINFQLKLPLSNSREQSTQNCFDSPPHSHYQLTYKQLKFHSMV